jgi:hypothetical protein
MQRYRIYIKNVIYMVQFIKFKNTADRKVYLALSAGNSGFYKVDTFINNFESVIEISQRLGAVVA